MTTKTNGRDDTEFKKMIVQKHEGGELVLNLYNDFNLKEGTVYAGLNSILNLEQLEMQLKN